jgi:hypothetical protein
MKTLWSKVEPFVWAFATLWLLYVVYALIVYRPKFFWDWPLWGQVVVIVVFSFWWKGFKSRLAKFLRESLRGLIAEEMNKAITLTTSPVLPDTTG